MNHLLPDPWIAVALLAATFQTVRFMLQKQLAQATLSAGGATFARFVYSAPFILILVAFYLRVSGADVPRIDPSFWGYAVLGGLLAGFVAIVLRNARDTWMLMGMIRRSYVLRRMGKIDVRFTDETCVPFSTRGLFRHYIVLPTGLLAQSNDVRIAVSHEVQHVRQRDLTWEIALELVRPFFFWNPAFAYCKRDVERVRELACDQQVLSRNTHPIRAYCECLLRVCQTSLLGDRRNQIITPSVPFVQVDRRTNASHSEAFLRHRIVSVLDGGKAAPHRNWAAMTMLSVFAMVILMTAALRPVNDWSHDRLMLSTIVNLERLNARDTAR